MIRMSQVINDVLIDLRNDLNFIDPNRASLERKFNLCQLDLSVKHECIRVGIESPLAAYESEGGLTPISGTNTLNAVFDSGDVTPTADHYKGWILTNNTRNAKVIVASSVFSGPVTLFLSRAIAGQTAGDDITLERIAKYLDLPWYFIRPFLSDYGVTWDNHPVDPASLSEVKSGYDLYAPTGIPRKYAIENQRLWIFPAPASAGRLVLNGARRTADCIRVTTTSAGSADKNTLISTGVPNAINKDDYFAGVEIEIMSGNARGEVVKVGKYSKLTGTFYFEGQTNIQIATSIDFEVLSPLPDAYRPAIDAYLKWQLLRVRKEFQLLARQYEADFNRLAEDARYANLLKETAHGKYTGGRSHQGNTYVIINT